jgi:flagellar biosynthesis chaperone FliJ
MLTLRFVIKKEKEKSKNFLGQVYTKLMQLAEQLAELRLGML